MTCQARFQRTQYSIDQRIELDVVLRSHMHAPVRFSALRVFFSDSTYDNLCTVVDPTPDSPAGT